MNYRADLRWQSLQEEFVREWDRDTETSEDAFLRRVNAAKAMEAIELEYEKAKIRLHHAEEIAEVAYREQDANPNFYHAIDQLAGALEAAYLLSIQRFPKI